MTLRRSQWIGGTAAALALLVSVPAEALRCGNNIITRGDHFTELLHYCGEPIAIHSRVSQRGVVGLGHVLLPGFVEDVLIEEWTYNFGPHKLMRLIRIENGIVENISHLGYGYTEP